MSGDQDLAVIGKDLDEVLVDKDAECHILVVREIGNGKGRFGCADAEHPIFGSVELVGFLATIVIATALPYTYKMDGHVGVEILVRLLGKKTQLTIDLFTRIISLILFCLVTWQMFLYAKDIHEVGEVSMNLEFPIHYIVYLLAFGLLVFSVTIIETIFKTIKELRE